MNRFSTPPYTALCKYLYYTSSFSIKCKPILVRSQPGMFWQLQDSQPAASEPFQKLAFSPVWMYNSNVRNLRSFSQLKPNKDLSPLLR